MSLFSKALNIGKAKVSAATAGIHSLLDSIQGLPTPTASLSEMMDYLDGAGEYVDGEKVNKILGYAPDEDTKWSAYPGNLRYQLFAECRKNMNHPDGEHMVRVIVFGLMAEHWDSANMKYTLPTL